MTHALLTSFPLGSCHATSTRSPAAPESWTNAVAALVWTAEKRCGETETHLLGSPSKHQPPASLGESRMTSNCSDSARSLLALVAMTVRPAPNTGTVEEGRAPPSCVTA